MITCTYSLCVQKLYYVQESHGIVVTDLAFLPDSLKGKNIKGNNETAMLSVAVDSRCQVHAVPNRSKSCIIIQRTHWRPCIITSDLTLSVPLFSIFSRILSYLASVVLLWPHGGGSRSPPTVPLSRIYLNHANVVTGHGWWYLDTSSRDLLCCCQYQQSSVQHPNLPVLHHNSQLSYWRLFQLQCWL